MTLLVAQDQRGRLDRHLGRVAGVQDDTGVWVDEVATALAAQQGSRPHGVLVREDVAAVELLDQRFPAARATELAVECVECLGLGRQNVLVPFDQFPGNFGIQRLEDAHS